MQKEYKKGDDKQPGRCKERSKIRKLANKLNEIFNLLWLTESSAISRLIHALL